MCIYVCMAVSILFGSEELNLEPHMEPDLQLHMELHSGAPYRLTVRVE